MILMIVGLLVAGFAIALLTSEESESKRLALSSSGPRAAPAFIHVLAIELGGNSKDWVDGVGSFVRSELQASSSDNPLETVQLIPLISVGAVTVQPTCDCLRGVLLLAPVPKEVDIYNRGSESTKRAVLRKMNDRRRRQIELAASAFEREVTIHDYKDQDPERLSPLALLDAARSQDSPGGRWVSVFSPLVSTVNDCLDNRSSNAKPSKVVEDCVRYKQLAAIPGRFNISVPAFLTQSSGQRLAAAETRNAMCVALGKKCRTNT